nr:hypothetical protein [uncultured Shimia sp.]
MPDVVLSPWLATVLFVLACLAGHRYRRAWKEEGPRWQLWVFGLIAALCLLIVGLVPLATNG